MSRMNVNSKKNILQHNPHKKKVVHIIQFPHLQEPDSSFLTIQINYYEKKLRAISFRHVLPSDHSSVDLNIDLQLQKNSGEAGFGRRSIVPFRSSQQ